MRELDKARAYAESLIKNAPDPIRFDLEGRSYRPNDAVFALLGSSRRTDRAVSVALIPLKRHRELNDALRRSSRGVPSRKAA